MQPADEPLLPLLAENINDFRRSSSVNLGPLVATERVDYEADVC
jgi:hypothetical protein